MPRHPVPFFQASPAAAGTGMLGFENGMAFHRRLSAVMFRICRCQFSGNKIAGMSSYCIHTLFSDILPVFGSQMKRRAETGTGQFVQCFFDCLHMLQKRTGRAGSLSVMLSFRRCGYRQSSVPYRCRKPRHRSSERHWCSYTGTAGRRSDWPEDRRLWLSHP